MGPMIWSKDDTDRIRNLPPGTRCTDPDTGEQFTLDRHTELGDGWWLSDGSWLRWHHVGRYLLDEGNEHGR
jgi:hypothetical protein